tara:strand:+ start:17305 stop:17952 length:648 start_codon:yes stop_codon:yes gene_type:complete
MRLNQPKKNPFLWAIIIGIFVVFAWFEGSIFGNIEKIKDREGISQSITEVKIGGPFNLIDHRGNSVTEKSFQDRHKLVFFGYTWCPDICPTELQIITEVLDTLGNNSKKIAALFITIDPRRDTQVKLANYLSHFHPEIIGLTGNEKQIATAAKAYRVYYNRPDQNTKTVSSQSSGDYIMDHSVYIYLISPEDKYITHFIQSDDSDKIAQEILNHL